MPHGPPHPEVNSRDWWEDYFEGDWERYEGAEQTRHFMARLLDELPDFERHHFAGPGRTILDWGCAFGEGAAALAGTFPDARVSGLDVAERAVQEARRRHPGVRFVRTDGAIPEDFDVVLTSNCLEHFTDPLDVARGHLTSCRDVYLALVPYAETPLREEHLARFDDTTFPEELGRFVKVHQAVIDVDPVRWPGQQLLAIYGSADYALRRLRAHGDERAKWEAFYADGADAPARPDDTGEVLVDLLRGLLPAGATVAEAGCGEGRQSLALAQAGFDVTLMDFAENALAAARELFGRAKARAAFRHVDVMDPPLDWQYDLVLNAGSIEHYTPDQQVAYVRGMARMSRRYVLLLWPNGSCPWYWWWRLQEQSAGRWPFGKEAPPRDLETVFEQAGLRPVGQTTLGTDATRHFLRSLEGLEDPALTLALELLDSPLTPDDQRQYLIAGLAVVGDAPDPVLDPWRPADRTASHVGQLSAALADALAMSIAAQRRADELARLLERDHAERRASEEEAARRLRALSARADAARTRSRPGPGPLALAGAAAASAPAPRPAQRERPSDSELEARALREQVTRLEQEREVLVTSRAWRLGSGVVRTAKRMPGLSRLARDS